MVPDLEWKSAQDHDGLLRGWREVDGPSEEAPLGGSPRSQVLATIAATPRDLEDSEAELRCENRELRAQIKDYERACTGLARERDQLVVRNAELREENTVLGSKVAASVLQVSESRRRLERALVQSAELLAKNLRLERALALAILPCGHPTAEFRLIEDSPNGSYCNECVRQTRSKS